VVTIGRGGVRAAPRHGLGDVALGAAHRAAPPARAGHVHPIDRRGIDRRDIDRCIDRPVTDRPVIEQRGR
jgi:hypothetical protein